MIIETTCKHVFGFLFHSSVPLPTSTICHTLEKQAKLCNNYIFCRKSMFSHVFLYFYCIFQTSLLHHTISYSENLSTSVFDPHSTSQFSCVFSKSTSTRFFFTRKSTTMRFFGEYFLCNVCLENPRTDKYPYKNISYVILAGFINKTMAIVWSNKKSQQIVPSDSIFLLST